MMYRNLRSQTEKIIENKCTNIKKKVRNCLDNFKAKRHKWKNTGDLEDELETSITEDLMGVLRIRVVRGINLAIRDVRTSDPYVIIKMGKQRVKTRVIKNALYPEWNEDLTLFVSDPSIPIKLRVYDQDIFTKDDQMGDAEFDVRENAEVLRMNLAGMTNGTVIKRIQPSAQNCLSQETCLTYVDGKITQEVRLKLRNVECGEVDIQLQWIPMTRKL